MLNIFKDKRVLTSVDNSPYVEAVINYKIVVINTLTGKEVYNSANNTGAVFNTQFLPEDNEYLVIGKEGTHVVASLIDLRTGETKWKIIQGEAKTMFASMFTFKSNNTNEAVTSQNMIYSLYFGKLSAIDRVSGVLQWTGEQEYSKVFPLENNQNIVGINNKGFLSSKQYLNVLESASGKPIWKEAIKTKYIVYLEDWGDKILVAHYNGFNFYNLNGGNKIWKKDAKGSGLKSVIPINKDYLYIAENEMMLIDQNGEKKWKKTIEISDDKEDEVHYLDMFDSNVLYLTATYGNMVDYDSGKKIWKRDIKFNPKRPFLFDYDYDKNIYMIFNDEKLYKFDSKTQDRPKAFVKVNAKREKEINSIELFPWGVSVSGPIEVMGIGNDSIIKYHKTYRQPGDGGRVVGQVASFAGAAYFGVAGMKKSMQGSEIRMITRDQNGKIQEHTIRKRDETKMRDAQLNYQATSDFMAIKQAFGKRY